MFSRIRRRLTYANITMTIALLFAMSGGAYAAGKYLITSSKQIKPSVLAQLKGKTGPVGKSGPAGEKGPSGSGGPAGPAGPVGPVGTPGVAGTAGTAGGAGPAGPAGPKGAAGSVGPTGPTGQTGFTKTLPKGATETGVWVVRGSDNAEKELKVTAISFPIPLESSVGQTRFIALGGTPPSECSGTVEKPEAEPGALCVYAGESFVHKIGLKFASFLTPSKGLSKTETAGVELFFETLAPTTAGEEVSEEGTWAATAP
jgi:hypothetical protein